MSVTLSYIVKAKFRRKWLLIVVAALLLHWAQCSFLSTSGTSCDDTQCLHGLCFDGRCVCKPGWQGTACDQCGGRIR